VCYLLISSSVLFTFDFGLVVPFKLPAIDPAAWWRKKVLGLKYRPGAGWRNPCKTYPRASTYFKRAGCRVQMLGWWCPCRVQSLTVPARLAAAWCQAVRVDPESQSAEILSRPGV